MAAAVAVLVYFCERHETMTVLGARALLAGILGNLTDRARLGYVIDFIVVHALWHWPTFNVADASISVARCCSLMICFLRRKRQLSVVRS